MAQPGIRKMLVMRFQTIHVNVPMVNLCCNTHRMTALLQPLITLTQNLSLKKMAVALACGSTMVVMLAQQLSMKTVLTRK